MIDRNELNEHFMARAHKSAIPSKDRSLKVGCVITTENYRFLVNGYNGFPSGLDDTIEARHQRPEKYIWTEHAERNAIYNAARNGIRIEYCRAYVNWHPCVECARALIQVGMIELITYRPDFDHERFGASFVKAAEMLTACGIPVTFMDKV